MTTTAFKIDLIVPAIGMNRFTSHSRTPTTIRATKTCMRGILISFLIVLQDTFTLLRRFRHPFERRPSEKTFRLGARGDSAFSQGVRMICRSKSLALVKIVGRSSGDELANKPVLLLQPHARPVSRLASVHLYTGSPFVRAGLPSLNEAVRNSSSIRHLRPNLFPTRFHEPNHREPNRHENRRISAAGKVLRSGCIDVRDTGDSPPLYTRPIDLSFSRILHLTTG